MLFPHLFPCGCGTRYNGSDTAPHPFLPRLESFHFFSFIVFYSTTMNTNSNFLYYWGVIWDHLGALWFICSCSRLVTM